MNNWNRMPDALKEQVFNHLNSLAAVANLSEADRIAYDKALDRFSVSRIVEEDTLERGRREERYKNAVSLKKAGVPIDTIAKALGLSADEVEKL